MSDRPKGPLGIDPLAFSSVLFAFLILFVVYLLLPRAVRKQYFGAYPKRHAWSARSRSRRGTGGTRSTFGGAQSSVGDGGSYTGGSSLGAGSMPSHRQISAVGLGANANNHMADFQNQQQQAGGVQQNQQQQLLDLHQNDEIVISAAMQQLRDPGVLIVAHGSRGKPKTVRLQLTESAITWRTETRKKSKDNKPKMGKLHQVPLSHIMYVDVGKQTTALRRVENASVSEALCFSLLTKEGSLDLEANSPRERDALVSCFSLVLDEVHAQNWRDIYRGPSSDMPSSFDELDAANAAANEGPK
mmetsp:Transcript_7251/g.15104  ORF Transcript_7251/g.15104 Transcript_7251/m.15104 type:complete len:301 (-) Transcript_7251:122-1024(-)|eukprot:CAMPEP_0172462460 /NCGR_PEP_ID=MMETSP1065-20121228/43917_1 /TAXON_ID=265537 /ORGANISM="Amphiprora paludosa, Strain CCMP125" /LENGTH=300 /DNA_ID=CAMNT_0013218121 /DNA_START=233 /DNA_END=1135 /DNA_ORIENTATION=-